MAFAHDVFISYAHVDDLPLDPARPGQSAGWVTTLVQHLENFLGQEIGRAEGFTVWRDKYNLRGNNSLTPEIKAELERTALFIAILSPGYIASAWCPDEARFFAQRFAGDLAGRVLVVEKAKLDDAAAANRPSQLSVLVHRRQQTAADLHQANARTRGNAIFPAGRGSRARTFSASSRPWPAARCSRSRRCGR